MASVFAIVEFPKEQSCQCIPIKWLKDNKSCYYPNTFSFKIPQLVKQQATPFDQSLEFSWSVHEVRLLGTAKNYQDARKKSSKAELTSNIESEEELPTKRRAVSKVQSQRSSSSDDLEESAKKELTRKGRYRNRTATNSAHPKVLFNQYKVPTTNLDQITSLGTSAQSYQLAEETFPYSRLEAQIWKQLT